MKITIEQMEWYLNEMKKAQQQHPKAKVYYSPTENEVRVTYPLPQDFDLLTHNTQ